MSNWNNALEQVESERHSGPYSPIGLVCRAAAQNNLTPDELHKLKVVYNVVGQSIVAREYSLAELEALPTLATGQADSLKVDDEHTQVWLSRCSVADGEPYDNRVSIYHRFTTGWELVHCYPAR